MIIQGYRIKTTDFSEIETTISKIRQKLDKTVNNEYKKLVAEEVAFLVDQVALGVLNRDNNLTIYDAALRNVNTRITQAEFRNIASKYNLKCFGHILSDGEYIYIKVICPNKKLLSAFKGIEDYSLNEIECEDKRNAKTLKWTELHKVYSKNEPVAIDFTLNLIKDIEHGDLKSLYPKKMERAESEARHSILSKILGQISSGEQIPPFRLMSYMDEAIDIFSNNVEYKNEYNEKVTKLLQIYTDLNENDEYIYDINTDSKQQNILEEE